MNICFHDRQVCFRPLLPFSLLLLLSFVGSAASAPALPHTTIATLPVGAGPHTFAVNSATNRIFVANQKSNTVTMVDGANSATVKTIAVGSTPRAIAVNPTNNKIYVANADSNNVAVIDGTTYSTVTADHGRTNLRNPDISVRAIAPTARTSLAIQFGRDRYRP